MYDTIITGAGLAGLQCARLLATRGLRVLLLDRKASVADSIHTTGIFVRKTWEDFALPDELLGKPLRRVTLYSPARRALALEADHAEFRVGRMGWLYLWMLEQCGRAGVTWMPSTRLVACEAGSVTLERRGRRERIATRYVVGADGARSMVARQLGLDVNRELLVGVEEIGASGGGDPQLHCYLDPRIAPGYIAWVVDDGEESHVGVAGYPDRFKAAESLQKFRATLSPESCGGAADSAAYRQRVAGGFTGKSNAVERRGGLIPVGGVLRRIANERGLLVGDAAGAVSPLTAGGLDAALRLSRFAAEVIEAYLDRGDASVLREYTGDRFRARFLARRWMRRMLRAFESAPAMELACALMRTPPMKRVAEHVFFARGSFPDASLGQPLGELAEARFAR